MQDSVWGEAPVSILQTPVMTVVRWAVAGLVPLSAAAGHQAAAVGGAGQDWSKCYLFWDWGGGDGDAVTSEK